MTDNQPQTTAFQSPFCSELRSKKFYMLQGIATEAAEYMDGSNSIWCFKTQLPVGPDGGKVCTEKCVAGRGCYQSAL